MEAGSHRPEVHILGVGFAISGVELTNITVPLTFTAINNTNVIYIHIFILF